MLKKKKMAKKLAKKNGKNKKLATQKKKWLKVGSIKFKNIYGINEKNFKKSPENVAIQNLAK